jgi:hypothetical protein
MITLVPPPPDEVRQPLESVLEQALAGEAPPPWVAVEDRDGRWIRFAAAASPEERSRSVVALSSEAALISAVRLGIGGAMWLPPSTAGARAALDGAATRLLPPTTDAWIADLAVPPGGDLVAVTWANRPFWRCQLGAPALTLRLVELAAELDVLPAVVSWPALLVAARPSREIHSAWKRVTESRRVPSQGVAVVSCDHDWGHCGLVTAAMRALATREPDSDGAGTLECPGQAVYELPSGRLLGHWAPSTSDEQPSTPGWTATPEDETDAGFRWRLRSAAAQDRWASDIFDSASVGDEIARVPGWLAGEVAPGRPAGLLVEHLAEAASRTGAPLWVSNVDQDGLQYLLRLPGSFWVDGPAVPEAG